MRRAGAGTSGRRRGSCLAAALAWLALGAAAAATAQDAANEGGATRPEPRALAATLTLLNRPVATFRATVAGNTPAERVRNARERLEELDATDKVKKIEASAVSLGGKEGVIVTVGGHAVFGFVPEDVDSESGLTLTQVVDRARVQLRTAFIAQEQQGRLTTNLRAAGITLLATGLLVLVFKSIRIARRWAVARLDVLLRGWKLVIAGIDIAPTLATLERAVMRVLGWGVLVACLYLWATLVLQQYPYTAPFGARLSSYLQGQLAAAGVGAVRALPSIAMVIGVLLLTRALAIWASRLFAEVECGARELRWIEKDQARATRRIVVGVIWALGIATAFPLLPWSQNAVFRGVSVVFGLGLSLASTGLVNQWISGLVILYSRSFKLGDFVAVAGVEGFVTEIGPLATKLRNYRREEISLPNAVVVSDKLVNHTRLAAGNGELLATSLSVGYPFPWQQVRTLLLQAASETPGIRAEPAPRVLQWELAEFSVGYRLHVHLESADQRAAVRSALHARILDVFGAAGVQIMTPHFESQPENLVVAAPLIPHAQGAKAAS